MVATTVRPSVSHIDLFAVTGRVDQIDDATLLIVPMFEEARHNMASGQRVKRVQGVFRSSDPYRVVVCYPEQASEAYLEAVGDFFEDAEFQSSDEAVQAARDFNADRLASGDFDIDRVPLAQVLQVGRLQGSMRGLSSIRLDGNVGVEELRLFRPVRVVWAGIV